MSKIFDCITFFNENFIANLRFEILNEIVDYFVICESKYDHQGRKKNLNFQLKNQNFKDKIIYIVLDKSFPENGDSWRNQALQREFILEKLNYIDSEDCIMFSDPDEIPNPKILANLKLEKKKCAASQPNFSSKNLNVRSLTALPLPNDDKSDDTF